MTEQNIYVKEYKEGKKELKRVKSKKKNGKNWSKASTTTSEPWITRSVPKGCREITRRIWVEALAKERYY